MVFTFGASTTAANFSYGLEGQPTRLSIEQLQRGELPPGTQLGDYVEVRGTPDVGNDLERIGTRESEIAVSSRYSASYFYFRLEETGDSCSYRRRRACRRASRTPGSERGGASSRPWEP